MFPFWTYCPQNRKQFWGPTKREHSGAKIAAVILETKSRQNGAILGQNFSDFGRFSCHPPDLPHQLRDRASGLGGRRSPSTRPIPSAPRCELAGFGGSERPGFAFRRNRGSRACGRARVPGKIAPRAAAPLAFGSLQPSSHRPPIGRPPSGLGNGSAFSLAFD